MSSAKFKGGVGVLLALASIAGAQAQEYTKSLAPYVPSPESIVTTMLQAAEVKKDELVYDLGSGDGRVLIAAAKEFHARSIGVEISPSLVQEAQERIKAEGLEQQCRVIHGDALEVDLSDADVVVLYLLTSSNELLRPILEDSLHPGARVVSHDFEVRGWHPYKVVQEQAHGRTHQIYVYRMPDSR